MLCCALHAFIRASRRGRSGRYETANLYRGQLGMMCNHCEMIRLPRHLIAISGQHSTHLPLGDRNCIHPATCSL